MGEILVGAITRTMHRRHLLPVVILFSY